MPETMQVVTASYNHYRRLPVKAKVALKHHAKSLEFIDHTSHQDTPSQQRFQRCEAAIPCHASLPLLPVRIQQLTVNSVIRDFLRKDWVLSTERQWKMD